MKEKTWEITVRVTHDVTFVVDGEDILKAGNEAMRRANCLYDNVYQVSCIEGAEIKEEGTE